MQAQLSALSKGLAKLQQDAEQLQASMEAEDEDQHSLQMQQCNVAAQQEQVCVLLPIVTDKPLQGCRSLATPDARLTVARSVILSHQRCGSAFLGLVQCP